MAADHPQSIARLKHNILNLRAFCKGHYWNTLWWFPSRNKACTRLDSCPPYYSSPGHSRHRMPHPRMPVKRGGQQSEMTYNGGISDHLLAYSWHAISMALIMSISCKRRWHTRSSKKFILPPLIYSIDNRTMSQVGRWWGCSILQPSCEGCNLLCGAVSHDCHPDLPK